MDFNVKKLAADAGTFLSRAVQVRPARPCGGLPGTGLRCRGPSWGKWARIRGAVAGPGAVWGVGRGARLRPGPGERRSERARVVAGPGSEGEPGLAVVAMVESRALACLGSDVLLSVPHPPASSFSADPLLVLGMAGLRPGRLQSRWPRGKAGAAQGQGRRGEGRERLD